MVLHTMAEATAPQVAEPAATCPKCRAELLAGAKFCEACGARIGGMPDVHARARSRQKARTSDNLAKNQKDARRYILLVAIIQTGLAGFVLWLSSRNSLSQASPLVWGLLAVGLCFWGCWFWARSNAFAATLTALILYATLILADLAVDPASILRGVIFKVLIVLGLIKGVRSALAARMAAADESQS
jgi:hypothetical protein